MAKISAFAFVLLWFLWFGSDGLFAQFAPDDMMNLYGYWQPGPWRALASQFMLGTNVYRPMGAVFYLPLYYAFGLEPMPCRAVVLVLLAANVWLVYVLARRLGCVELAAILAALLSCYHAGLADLYYNTATVYDVLCTLFYSWTLVYYIGIRREDRPLRRREWAAFLALYVCALNSKEMAVTLPVMVVIYEFLYRQRRFLAPAVVAGVITAIYVAGKAFGADPLMAQEAYRPIFTWQRFFESSRLHANDLFYGGFFFTTRRVLFLWLAATILAWWRPSPVLRFCWALILIGPLPIVFLKGRTHSCLYLLLVAWGIFLAVLIVDFAAAAARLLRTRAMEWAIPAVAVALLALVTAHEKRERVPAVAHNGDETARVIRMFEAADPQVKPKSNVLLLDDPFEEWDAKFIAELWFRDRSISVWLQRKTPLSPEEIRREMRYVFRFEPARLVQVKP